MSVLVLLPSHYLGELSLRKIHKRKKKERKMKTWDSPIDQAEYLP